MPLPLLLLLPLLLPLSLPLPLLFFLSFPKGICFCFCYSRGVPLSQASWYPDASASGPSAPKQREARFSPQRLNQIPPRTAFPPLTPALHRVLHCAHRPSRLPLDPVNKFCTGPIPAIHAAVTNFPQPNPSIFDAPNPPMPILGSICTSTTISRCFILD